MAEQNFENHAQRVLGFLITGGMLILTLVGSLVNLWLSWGDHQREYSAALLVVLTAAVIGVGAFARTFPLKAQDRAIRAEENLRHYVLTGKLLDTRLEPLQIVALRFASDTEFAALAKKAAESSMAPKEIKQAIRTWRPDTYRV